MMRNSGTKTATMMAGRFNRLDELSEPDVLVGEADTFDAADGLAEEVGTDTDALVVVVFPELSYLT